MVVKEEKKWESGILKLALSWAELEGPNPNFLRLGALIGPSPFLLLKFH
jgi:hypothetical protein